MVFVVLAAAVIVSFFLPNSSKPTEQIAGTPEVRTSVSVPPAESGCPAQEAVEFNPEQVILTEVKSTWYRVGDMTAPTSPTGGPAVTDPFPACFPRTPEGALYAAASFAVGVIAAQAEGTDRDFFIARASHTGNYNLLIAELASQNQNKTRPTIRITGYQWNSYSPNTASVRIKYTLVTGPRAGQDVAITYTMTWENNDWLLVVPGKNDVVAIDPTATVYHPWGGS
jgi:hypothetical protein